MCSWRRKGDNSREREKRRKIDLFEQTLKVMFHIITRAYESRFAYRTLISTELNRSLFRSAFVKQRTQSLKRQSTDSKNPLSGSQQPPLL